MLQYLEVVILCHYYVILIRFRGTLCYHVLNSIILYSYNRPVQTRLALLDARLRPRRIAVRHRPRPRPALAAAPRAPHEGQSEYGAGKVRVSVRMEY